jgi:hypothetical protein
MSFCFLGGRFGGTEQQNLLLLLSPCVFSVSCIHAMNRQKYTYFLELYIHVTVHRNGFLFSNQPDALIIQIYSVIKLYMFRASSVPIIRSSVLYIRHW